MDVHGGPYTVPPSLPDPPYCRGPLYMSLKCVFHFVTGHTFSHMSLWAPAPKHNDTRARAHARTHTQTHKHTHTHTHSLTFAQSMVSVRPLE